jgi:hypothetical protein
VGSKGESQDSPVEIKRNSIWSDVSHESILEFIVINCPGVISVYELVETPLMEEGSQDVRIEILERDPIIRIRSLQERFKHTEVFPANEATTLRVRYAKEYGELGPTDPGQVARRRDSAHETITIQKSTTPGRILSL